MTTHVRTEKRKTTLEVARPAGSLQEAHTPSGTFFSGDVVFLRGGIFLYFIILSTYNLYCK